MFKTALHSLKVAGFLTVTSFIKGNLWVAVLIVFILTLVSSNLMFVPALLEGVNDSANDKMIEVYSGDIIIESNEASSLITGVGNFTSDIENIPGVQSVISRLRTSGRVYYEDNYKSATVCGIDPENDPSVFNIPEHMAEGSYLSPEDTDMIVLGIEIAGADNTDAALYARSLKTVHTGDNVSITYSGGITKNYTVKGIFDTEFTQTDLQIFITEKELLSIFPQYQDMATVLNVKTTEDTDISGIVSSIEEKNDRIVAYSWKDYTGGIISSMTQSFDLINIILSLVNALVAGFTIYIITFIDVSNKRRQIGIQRAIGITPGSISMTYVFRAIIYSLLAIIISGSLFYIYNILPVDMKFSFHFPFGDAFLVTNFESIVRTAILLFGVSIIAAIIPVIGVLRSKLIDTIWG